MILRRLAGHLRQQDWVAVTLELFIVILGVFLGFQVTAWNEDRQARNEERAALVRLQREAEGAVAYWRYEVSNQQRHNRNRRQFLELLDRGAMPADQKPIVDDAIMRIGHYPQFNPPRTVYDELVAGGGLGRIESFEVREAVAAYAAEVDFAIGQLTQFRTNLPALLNSFDGRVFSVFAPDRASLRRYVYDFPKLADDDVFVSAMVEAVRDQMQFLSIRENALRRAERMCDAVSRALSMVCNPDDFSDEEFRDRDGVNRDN